MRFARIVDSFTWVGLALLFAEMTRFLASEPLQWRMVIVGWHVPLFMGIMSAMIACVTVRELVLDLRGYYR